MVCPRCQLFYGEPCNVCRTYSRIGFFLQSGRLHYSQEQVILGTLRNTAGILSDFVEVAGRLGERGVPGPEPGVDTPAKAEEANSEEEKVPAAGSRDRPEGSNKKEERAKKDKDRKKERKRRKEEESGAESTPEERKKKVTKEVKVETGEEPLADVSDPEERRRRKAERAARSAPRPAVPEETVPEPRTDPEPVRTEAVEAEPARPEEEYPGSRTLPVRLSRPEERSEFLERPRDRHHEVRRRETRRPGPRDGPTTSRRDTYNSRARWTYNQPPRGAKKNKGQKHRQRGIDWKRNQARR